jgi:transcriptional regulator with XRE-family HTH domain
MERDMSFGEWLRRRRKTLDLTQEALSEQVGCSVATIRKIESDERRPSRQIAELLATALAIPSHDRPTFLQVARGERRAERLALADPLMDRPVEHPLVSTIAPASPTPADPL